MIHKMRLKDESFEQIKNGNKTIEFRLCDEKRQKIKIGDKIEFSRLPDLQEEIQVLVLDLYKEKTFERLFRKIFTDEEKIKRKIEEMYQYYSPEQETEYGVIGIKIKLISSKFKYTYNKLVRDKIPKEIDKASGRKCKYRILDDKEYLKELNKKVIEEANEFVEENSIEELGDLMEVIKAIMRIKDYKMEDVEKAMNAKEEKKGNFSRKIFLEYVNEEERNLAEEKELRKKFRKG